MGREEDFADNHPPSTSPEPDGGGLIVGNYCHDVLFRDGAVAGEGLGGAASFLSNVLDPLSPHPSSYISKVGLDFSYSVSQPPITSASFPTTLFHAHFPSGGGCGGYHGDRILRRVRACEAILPSDLPSRRFEFGLAAGVAGEILPETLTLMLDMCRVVFVDVQGLIRVFDPLDGTVGLVQLRSSAFFGLLPRIGFLKASAEEAPFVDVEEARKLCCVIVTEGKDGCRVYWKDGEVKVEPFAAIQIDPTGAGDSFLGGFVVGLSWGLTVPDAALLGNFFGALTVNQIGIPKFELNLLKEIWEKLISVYSRTDDFPVEPIVVLEKQETKREEKKKEKRKRNKKKRVSKSPFFATSTSISTSVEEKNIECMMVRLEKENDNKAVRQELERRGTLYAGHCQRNFSASYQKSVAHKELHQFLIRAAELHAINGFTELDDGHSKLL